MRKRGKWIIGVITAIALVAMLPVLTILPWMASSAVAAAYYLVFTTQPTPQELAGEYSVSLEWGDATLMISPDNTFQEIVIENGKTSQTIKGHWSVESADVGHTAEVTMSPFIQVQTSEHGRRFDTSTLLFNKPRFGPIFAELDPDSGSRFKKQSR